jgi:uncharacterized membrane protein (DUF4010 family)
VTPFAAVTVLGDGSELAAATRLAIATLVGLGVGIEREWSGHASGPRGRFAGMRTFALLGLVGGGAGLFAARGYGALAATLLATGTLFAVAAYIAAVRRPDAELDGTTEAAAIVVLTLGALAGIGQTMLAAGAGAIVVLALGEKARLHWIVGRIGEREMRAALQFAVLALVILPLLPNGPYGPFEVRPRALWALVLVFLGVDFAAYIARRVVGEARGYALTGLLGGFVSSTAVTLQFSRLSRQDTESARALALGVVAACTVLFLRVAAVSAALDARVALALMPYLVPPAIVGVVVIAMAIRRGAVTSGPKADAQNPLRLWSAIQMVALFQATMIIVSLVRAQWGSTGVVASAIALGLTDVDALTVSMTRVVDGTDAAALAALGIGVGILTNTIFKLGLALVLGAASFRRWAAGGLALLGAATALGIWVASRISP